VRVSRHVADPSLPKIEGHIPTTRHDRRRDNALDHSGTTYHLAADGRPHARGYRFKRSEARKVVPKRRYNLKTPDGIIRKRAYDLDVTREQMAKAIGLTKAGFDGMLANWVVRLKPWMVDALAPLLALTPEDITTIHNAVVAKLGWKPKPEPSA
jgi:hypothetical protein